MQIVKTSRWNLLVLLFAGLLVAGCSSTATNEEPAEPQEPVEETSAPVEPVEEVQEQSDFNAQGLPVDQYGNPLDRTFYFGYDQSVLNPADLAALEVHAQILRRNPSKNVVIEGHCDERGTREYNLALGERRADSVRSFLLSAGVSAGQMETVSYGEEQPQDPGHTEGSWSRNRRAVLSYR